MSKESKNNGTHKERTGALGSDPCFSETDKNERKSTRDELNTHVSNSMSPPKNPNPNPKKDR